MASSAHLTTAMALVASSRRPKRRSLSEFAAASASSSPHLPPPPSPASSSTTKRRRSSLLRRPRHLPPPHDSSSHHSNLHLQIVPSSSSSASSAAASPLRFVKTDPIPNLAAVPLHDDDVDDSSFSDILNSDDDPHLHRVPSFFAADHLLIDVGCKSDDCSRPVLSAAIPPAASKLEFSTSPISRLSISDSATCSRSPATSADDGSVSGVSMDRRLPSLPLWEACEEEGEEESCDYLSHGFYEMETGMRSIMGDGVDVDASSSSVSHFCLLPEVPSDELDAADYGRPARSSGTTTGKRSSCAIDTDRAMMSSSESAQQATSSGSLQSSTTTLQLPESDEEYRIDLMDFDIPENSGSSDRKRKVLKLALDYEEIASEWSDRGPVRTDGRWPAEEGASTELDLSEWEAAVAAEGREVDAAGEGGGGGDGTAEEEAAAAAALAAQRQASVLRYREKRRTRLFAKKIRYEVRKLNAERRPRMKGRFIKRSEVE